MGKNLWVYLLISLFCIACSTENGERESDACRFISGLGDAPLSNQFRVKVNGVEASVEKIGKIDIPIHYTQMVYDETKPIQIEVIVDNPIQSYVISPLRKGVKAKAEGNRLLFTVDKAAYLLVKINNLEDLYLLINPVTDYQAQVRDKEIINVLKFGVDTTGVSKDTKKIQAAIDEASRKQAVLYFPKGKYHTGELYMRSNMTVLLADEALIMGSTDPNDYQDKSLIRMDSVSNFQMLGYGTVDGAGWAGLRRNGAREFHLVYASNCKDVLYDGVVLRDPTFWNTRVYRSERFHMKNLKILNNRPYKNWTNTDGVDFDSSVDCSLVNAVIHAGDDNVVVKGLDSERVFATERILFDNILTVSNSAAAKIGTETCVEYFRDVTFKNIDVVKCKRGMVINGFDSARIENVRFENITIEGFDFNGAEAPRLVDFEITDNSWRECTGNCAIDGVEISNVNVLTNLNGVESQIFGKDGVHNINNVIIRDCRVLGRSISSSVDINLSVNPFVKKIFFISD